METFLQRIYGSSFNSSTDIEPSAWREVLRIMNEAAVNGITQSRTSTAIIDRKTAFLNSIKHSNEVFSAFKVHTMAKQMAGMLHDEKGNLKPFNQWRQDIDSIASHHTNAWLRTEYNTAVIRAHRAADWQEFIDNADVMPNLRWMPTTSPNPENSHAVYWRNKLTLPVGDAFWNSHHPGDRWNCNCSLQQTDEPVNPLPHNEEPTTPHRGLDNNPGKDGHIFNDTHPYFPKNCNACPFNSGIKNKLLNVFNNQKKDCFNCQKINNNLKKINTPDIVPPKVETYKDVYKGKVFTSPYHGENERVENERLAKFIADKLKHRVYLLPRLDPENPTQKVLRSSLLPQGVFERKNPDFYMGGKLYDGKSMAHVIKTNNKKKHHNDILNRIKSAKEQADNIILEIPKIVSRRTISQTVNGYLKQSKKERIIIVKHGNKCYVYK